MKVSNRDKACYKNYIHIEVGEMTQPISVMIFILAAFFNIVAIALVVNLRGIIPTKNYPTALFVVILLEGFYVLGSILSIAISKYLSELVTLVLFENHMLIYPSKHYSSKKRKFKKVNYSDVITYDLKHEFHGWNPDKPNEKVEWPHALLVINSFDSKGHKKTYMTRVTSGWELEEKFIDLIGENKFVSYVTKADMEEVSLPN